MYHLSKKSMKCSEKITYETKAFAKKQRKFLELKHKKKLHVYKCDECRWYHLHSWTNERKEYFRERKANRKNLH